MRMFIAIKVNLNTIFDDILLQIKRFGKEVEKENIHLTLKFLGELNDYSGIIDRLGRIEFNKFTMELAGMDCFPNVRNARVLFIKAHPEDTLKELSNKINEATPEVKPDHPFTPHITLVRLKKPSDLNEIIAKYRDATFLKEDINYFSLFKSTLTPKGPIYDEIKKFQLI